MKLFHMNQFFFQTSMKGNPKAFPHSAQHSVCYCTLPVVVVLVDDGDGARMQVDPEKVRPHLHAALQPVALLDAI